jgi:hypothetical protein
MNYTKIKDLSTLQDKAIIEAVAGTIGFIGDPETKQSDSTGKAVTKQPVKLVSSDGTEVWCDLYNNNQFLDRADKGRKVSFCSTVKEGQMQGVNLSIYNGKTRLRLFSGTNITFHDERTTQPQQQQEQPKQQSQPQQQTTQTRGGYCLEDLGDTWEWCYRRAEGVIGSEHVTAVVAATATMLIQARNEKLSVPKTAVAAVLAEVNTAKSLAETIIKKGGCDIAVLPSGEQLDEIVDFLFDKASENMDKSRIGTAFDACVAKFKGSKEDATKAIVADWAAFISQI